MLGWLPFGRVLLLFLRRLCARCHSSTALLRSYSKSEVSRTANAALENEAASARHAWECNGSTMAASLALARRQIDEVLCAWFSGHWHNRNQGCWGEGREPGG